VFTGVRGVVDVQSGYAGGHRKNPGYREVCRGTTGHAEVVRVEFDPEIISYEVILQIFFTIHDPTTLNRQGADIGTQYRSVIFYTTPAQQVTAAKVMESISDSGVWKGVWVTQVEPAGTFWPAEPEHHRYYERNPGAGYCQVVVAPKVAKARFALAEWFR
jgi:peptide-methionine (S)-S-oxide reductase